MKSNMHQRYPSISLSDILLIMSSALLAAYTIFRAWNLSFTFDESLSFNHIIPLSYSQILFFSDLVFPNNHVLNTLCMKVLSMIPLHTEFVLRVHIVAAHILFLVCAFFFFRNFITNPFIRVTGFLCVTMNPYILDFFSLARGYGLANSFMFAGFCCTCWMLAQRKNYQRIQALALLFMSLAVLSNFSYLYYFLILSLVIFFANYLQAKTRSYSGTTEFIRQLIYRNRTLITSSFLLASLICIPIYRLKQSGALKFGGNTGFWNDSVRSLIVSSFYGIKYFNSQTELIEYIIVFILFSGLTALVILARKKNNTAHVHNAALVMFISLLTFAGLAAISYLQFYIFGTKYLYQRTAQFNITLVSIIFVFCADIFTVHAKNRYVSLIPQIIFASLALPYIYHCVNACNLHYTYDWKYSAPVKTIIRSLEEKTQKDEKLLLGGSWKFYGTVLFYRDYFSLQWLKGYETLDTPNPYEPGRYAEKIQEVDYILIPGYTGYKKRYLDGIASISQIKQYPYSGVTLFKVQH